MVYAFPDQREALGQVRRDPGRLAAQRRRRLARRPSSTAQNREAMDAGADRRLAAAAQRGRAVGHPARDEPEAPGRGGVLRRVPERADRRGRSARRCSPPSRSPPRLNGYRRGRDPARLQPPDDVHRRPAEGAVLDALRRGRRTSPATSWTTAPGRTSSGRTSRCATCGRRSPGRCPAPGLEGAIYAGSGEALTTERLSRVYRREDGAEMRIDRCLIDANWGQIDRRGLPVLPAEQLRRHPAAQPRQVRRGVRASRSASTSASAATASACTGAFPTPSASARCATC